MLVLSTGSELVAPGEPLRPGQIHESNSLVLATAVDAAGGRARTLHFVPDDVEQFLATVRAELADADLLITSGGSAWAPTRWSRTPSAPWAPSSSSRSRCSPVARRGAAPSTASRW